MLLLRAADAERIIRIFWCRDCGEEGAEEVARVEGCGRRWGRSVGMLQRVVVAGFAGHGGLVAGAFGRRNWRCGWCLRTCRCRRGVHGGLLLLLLDKRIAVFGGHWEGAYLGVVDWEVVVIEVYN